MREPISTVPALEPTPQAIENPVEQLRAYHAIYSPFFQRREQRAGAQQYLHGLLLELPRQSIEPDGAGLGRGPGQGCADDAIVHQCRGVGRRGHPETALAGSRSGSGVCGTLRRCRTTRRSGGSVRPPRCPPGRDRDANRRAPACWREKPSPPRWPNWPPYCPQTAGCVARSRRGVKGRWSPVLRRCASSPCGRGCPAPRSGWSGGATS